MEESMKFNSSVCTSIEQSQRLLELGLKPETADMVYEYEGTYPYDCNLCILEDGDYISSNIITEDIPAWSLHRLLCMLDYDNADTFNIMPNLAYEDIIATISLRINCGAFNKEYLKQ